MGSPTEHSVLAVLERAELAARELRLAASAEAERIVASGRERADAITARAATRVAEALDELRSLTEDEADRAIEALEREADASARSGARATGDDATFARAVDLVVAAVLGQSRAFPGSDDGVSASRAEPEEGPS